MKQKTKSFDIGLFLKLLACKMHDTKKDEYYEKKMLMQKFEVNRAIIYHLIVWNKKIKSAKLCCS